MRPAIPPLADLQRQWLQNTENSDAKIHGMDADPTFTNPENFHAPGINLQGGQNNQ